MLGYASTIFGAIEGDLGNSGVLDPGLGSSYVKDFVQLIKPVIGDWKIGWTTWLLCDRSELEKKIQNLKEVGATVVAGGTAGEIAASRNEWKRYIELCVSLSFDRIEIAEGFLNRIDSPKQLVSQAKDAGLEVQYEVGRKDLAEDNDLSLKERLAIVDRWLDAGVQFLVIEAREVGVGFAMFSEEGEINSQFASELLKRCSLHQLIIETPTRITYTSALRHFGPHVHLGNIAPNELLRVETMRHALHADTIRYKEQWRDK